MIRPRSIAAFALMTALALPSHVEGSGRSYRNESLRIAAFEVPHDWQISPQVSYPKVLLMATRVGARLLLGAQHVLMGTTAIGRAADARAVLINKGWTDPRVTQVADEAGEPQRTRLEASRDTPTGRELLRQLYVVDGDLEVVLTLLTPAAHQISTLKDFEAAAASLRLAADEGPPAAPLPPALTASLDGGTPLPRSPTNDAPAGGPDRP